MFLACCCSGIDYCAIEKHLLSRSERRVSGFGQHVVDEVLLSLNTEVYDLHLST